MQSTRVQTGQLPNLFHVQSHSYIELPPNVPVIHIGKPNGTLLPDIDASNLPNADVVSRSHANIWVEGDNYFIEDAGSSNGTYLNGVRLVARHRSPLNPGDKIDFGKDNLVTFVFQPSNNIPVATSSAADDEQATLITKLTGSALMLAGFAFLNSSLIFSLVASPLVVLGILGILTLNYGGSKRHLGWVLIGSGVAIAVITGRIFLIPIVIGSIVAGLAAIAAGYQFLTIGKVENFNLLSLKGIFKK